MRFRNNVSATFVTAVALLLAAHVARASQAGEHHARSAAKTASADPNEPALIDASGAAWTQAYGALRKAGAAPTAERATTIAGHSITVSLTAARNKSGEDVLCVTTKDVTDKVATAACGPASNASTRPVVNVLAGDDVSIVSGPAPDFAAIAQIVTNAGVVAKASVVNNIYVAVISGGVRSLELMARDGTPIGSSARAATHR